MTGERRNNAVDPRFISLLAVYYTVHPDNSSLNYIYSSILAGHLAIFSDEIQAITNIIVKITIELCEVFNYENNISFSYNDSSIIVFIFN